MSLPTNLSDIPAHQRISLSSEERATLPDVQWESYTAPHKHLRSTNALGTWYIGHPKDQVGGHEPVELAYQTALAPGEDRESISRSLDALDVDDTEWWRGMATRSRQEFGRVYDQDYAKIFIDRSRRAQPGQDPEAILLEAGFGFAHEIDAGSPNATRVFRKVDGDSFFSVFINPTQFWLTHEKDGAQHHTNLLLLNTTEQAVDGGFIPRFFSPEVAEPIAACADMARYFTEHWSPEPRVSASRRHGL